MCLLLVSMGSGLGWMMGGLTVSLYRCCGQEEIWEGAHRGGRARVNRSG